MLLKTKFKQALKIFFSIVLVLIGLWTLAFWGVGMHGHIMFRPRMTEDWVLSGIVTFCFGLPLYWLAAKIIRKQREKV